ncbi:hypothetical protein ACLB90_17580 [Stenotrophomonas sp. LGBM10]|uniref:hypothetical protein n=1 Tax=Stenotrophomonas sp. LGBM10 TaxID=3390038 RepID=UPI00398A834A
MMKLALAWVVALPVSAGPPLSSQDRVEMNTRGESILIRTSEWPDFEGGLVAVEQRLSMNEDGIPTYRYSRQSKATQLYHEAFCLEKNARPAGGEAVLKGSRAAWICASSDDDEALGPEAAQGGGPGSRPRPRNRTPRHALVQPPCGVCTLLKTHPAAPTP